ncbi:uncharacterized protein LOC130379252 isoform X5 [Gadus chalcogrammus]|uniref:uncharacterized protein LOC130379252 isoform X5 n=1 Tax=Gadus chalcogrammus TaxID=1042646 RepID=UPI0024C2BC13|nr:uncharacterized protein LOC130379252 isoform X5 [Gadus chalcogrammus]
MDAVDHHKQHRLVSTAPGLSRHLKVDLPNPDPDPYPEETTTTTINMDLHIAKENNNEGQTPPEKSEDQEEGETTDEPDIREEETDQCPSDPDVPKLKRTESVFLTKEMLGNSDYKSMTSSEIIIVFNRRREGEVSKMFLTDFLLRNTFASNPDLDLALTDMEKKLCKYFERVEIKEEVPEDGSLSGSEDEGVMSSLSSNSSGLRPVERTTTEEDQESESQLTRGRSRTWTKDHESASSHPRKGLTTAIRDYGTSRRNLGWPTPGRRVLMDFGQHIEEPGPGLGVPDEECHPGFSSVIEHCGFSFAVVCRLQSRQKIQRPRARHCQISTFAKEKNK